MSDTTVAFVFPGQGSQSVGMLADLAERYPVVRETFAEAGEALEEDLWGYAQRGPPAVLDRTEITQPVMLAAGVAAWRVWRCEGGELPRWVAGHSLGEYTALVCAEALAFPAAVRLVHERGRYMQAAAPEGDGAVAAVLGLADEAVREACAEGGVAGVVEPVNFNAPGQVVIAGHRAAVEAAMSAAKVAGAKRAQLLPVSVPVHCALMRPAAERLRARLAETAIGSPTLPVLHNVDVSYAADPDTIRERLAEQLYSPVRWVETIERLRTDGANRFIEAGPGKVLYGLLRRIDRTLAAAWIADGDSLRAALGRR